MSVFDKYTTILERLDPIKNTGIVQKVQGLLIESQGPVAVVGELCQIIVPKEGRVVWAEVVGLREKTVQLMPFDEMEGIEVGCMVIAMGEPLSVPVSTKLLGRVLNALGKPIDDRGDMAECYAYLGHNDLSLGEFDSAWDYYRQALEIGMEIKMMPVLTETLVGISTLFSKTEKQHEAVNLAAFVTGQKECSYATRERARNMLEDFSQVMDTDEFEGAKNIGGSMDLDEALKTIEPALIA